MKLAFSTVGCPDFYWDDVYTMAKDFGYDGIEIDQYLRVPLSTIAQPLYRIGYEGTGILLDRIRYPDTAIRKVVLKSELIVRRSSHPDA